MAVNGEIKSFNIDTPKSEETHKSVTMVIEDSIGYYLHYSDIYFVRAILQTKRHLFPLKKKKLFVKCLLNLHLSQSVSTQVPGSLCSAFFSLFFTP